MADRNVHDPGNKSYTSFSKDIKKMNWKSFEVMIIDLFKKVYGTHEFEVRQTEFSKDGGRDGEGTFIIQPDSSSNDLSINITIWIEVKKRAKNVTGNDIGLHVLKAFNHKVTKLIITTNTDFTPDARKVLNELSSTHAFSHALVDGKRLYAIWRNYGSANIELVQAEEAFGHTHSENNVSVQISYGKKLVRGGVIGKIFSAEARSPFFIFVDFHLTGGKFESLPEYRLGMKEGTLMPYQTFSNIATIGSEERITHVWIGKFNNSQQDPKIGITFPNACAPQVTYPMDIRVEVPLFHFDPPPSLASKIKTLTNSIDSLILDGKYNCIMLYGNAGTGKSTLLKYARTHWLERSMIELCLDGEIENSESLLLNKIFKELFPVPTALFSEKQVSEVQQFLIGSGLPSDSAMKLSQAICKMGEIDAKEFSTDMLSDLLAYILNQVARRGKLTIIYEDLHKCQPSVLALLLKTHRYLRYNEVGNILMLFTSRKSTGHRDNSIRDEWIQHTASLLSNNDINIVELEAFSENEAIDTIKHIIPTFPLAYTRKVIEQVGTTAFGIREALLYMFQMNWIEFDAKIQKYVTTQICFHQFKRSIASKRFADVTIARIAEFKKSISESTAFFIEMGACIGSVFDSKWCMSAVGNPIPHNVYQNFLETSWRLGILRSALDEGFLKFDHDLIRSCILKEITPIRQKQLAARLYDTFPEKLGNDRLRASIAYQAAKPEFAYYFSERFGDSCMASEAYEDALEAYKMSLFVVDKSSTSKLRDMHSSQWFTDDALRTALPVVIDSFSRSERNQKILGILKKIIGIAGPIGIHAKDEIKAIISEAVIIATEEQDQYSLSLLSLKYGVLLFETNLLFESIAQYEKALSHLGERQDDLRGTVLIELAISQRHIGLLRESKKTLKKALLQVSKDCELKARILANAGSLYFHTDRKYTRRFWLRALHTAERCNSAHLTTHMLLDVAHLDLLENKLEDADVLYRKAQVIAEEKGLRGQLFRIYLQRGLLHLLSANKSPVDLTISENLIKEAESIAVGNGMYRKLWKVYANLANIYEASIAVNSNKPTHYSELIHTYDKYVLTHLLTLIQNDPKGLYREGKVDKSVIPALANILLRQHQPWYIKQDFSFIPSQVISTAKQLEVLMLSDNHQAIPPLVKESLKDVFNQHRFIFT